jgi:hypothetical protein
VTSDHDRILSEMRSQFLSEMRQFSGLISVIVGARRSHHQLDTLESYRLNSSLSIEVAGLDRPELEFTINLKRLISDVHSSRRIVKR